MLKNFTALEHKIGERVYQLFCDPNSPTSELKDALFEFMKFVGQVEDAAKAAQAPVPQEEQEPQVDVVD